MRRRIILRGDSMAQRISLDVIHVAESCSKDWGEMLGDERKRFCDHCQKSVHDLSTMTQNDAERLICESAGSLCVRFERDAGGKVMTLDYAPVREKRRWRKWWPVSIAACLVAVFTGAIFARPQQRSTRGMVMGMACTRPVAFPTTQILLGKVSCPQNRPPTSQPVEPQ